MKLHELIELAGDRVRFQNLSNCMTEFRSKKDEELITFSTESGTFQSGLVGMVVWIPADVARDARNAMKSEEKS